MEDAERGSSPRAHYVPEPCRSTELSTSSHGSPNSEGTFQKLSVKFGMEDHGSIFGFHFCCRYEKMGGAGNRAAEALIQKLSSEEKGP